MMGDIYAAACFTALWLGEESGELKMAFWLAAPVCHGFGRVGVWLAPIERQPSWMPNLKSMLADGDGSILASQFSVQQYKD
jgi:hypothetical protein